MEKFIDEAVEKMREHFLSAGFEFSRIEALGEIGRKDLRSELSKLNELLSQRPLPEEQIDNVLHALKGLLNNMGNVETARKISDLRNRLENDTENTVSELKQIFL